MKDQRLTSANHPPVLGQQKVSRDRGVPGQVTSVLGHVAGDTFGCPRTPLSWDTFKVSQDTPVLGHFTQLSQDT